MASRNFFNRKRHISPPPLTPRYPNFLFILIREVLWIKGRIFSGGFLNLTQSNLTYNKHQKQEKNSLISKKKKNKGDWCSRDKPRDCAYFYSEAYLYRLRYEVYTISQNSKLIFQYLFIYLLRALTRTTSYLWEGLLQLALTASQSLRSASLIQVALLAMI